MIIIARRAQGPSRYRLVVPLDRCAFLNRRAGAWMIEKAP
jgi:hypothetical protein